MHINKIQEVNDRVLNKKIIYILTCIMFQHQVRKDIVKKNNVEIRGLATCVLI